MRYTRVELATMHVKDESGLRTAWKIHGGLGSLVGSFVVDKPLTPAQLRRLPVDLRNKLESL